MVVPIEMRQAYRHVLVLRLWGLRYGLDTVSSLEDILKPGG